MTGGSKANTVTLRYRAQLAGKTGATEETAEAAAVKDVLKFIKTAHGAETEKIARTMLITVNGESILHLKHYRTALKAGDEIHFLPICGGG